MLDQVDLSSHQIDLLPFSGTYPVDMIPGHQHFFPLDKFPEDNSYSGSTISSVLASDEHKLRCLSQDKDEITIFVKLHRVTRLRLVALFKSLTLIVTSLLYSKM